jgi:hypothetical protein
MNLDVAASGIEESLNYFDGRGFSGAIRTEQPEALAGFNLEVEAIHGIDGRLSGILLEESTANNRFGHAREFS